MHEPYGSAEKVASPSTARRVALVAWGMSICLIFSATVIRILEGKQPVAVRQFHLLGHRFRLFCHRRCPDYRQRPGTPLVGSVSLSALGPGLLISVERYTAYGTVKGYMPLPRTEVFNWLGNIVWPLNLVFIRVSATSLPQWSPAYATLAHCVLAGGSSADPQYAGEWVVRCLHGRVWERPFCRFLEFTRRQSQSLSIASCSSGTCFTDPFPSVPVNASAIRSSG